MYTSFEEPAEQILREIESLGYTPKKIVKDPLTGVRIIDNKLFIKSFTLGIMTNGSLCYKYVRTIDWYGLDLVIVDGVRAIERVYGNEVLLELAMNTVLHAKRHGTTMLFSCVRDLKGVGLSDIDTLADIIIALWYGRKGDEIIRKITVLKMRGSPHSTKVKKLVFDKKGVRIE